MHCVNSKSLAEVELGSGDISREGLVIFSDSKSAIEAIRNGETNISCDIITLLEQLHSKENPVSCNGYPHMSTLRRFKNRVKPDMTSVMLGDVGALPVEGKNFATVSVVVELPEGVVIKDDEQYPISSGLLIATNTIWSAMANYTMKNSAPPNLEEEQWPEASAHYDEEQKVVPGHLAEVEIWVDTKIQTISTVVVEVEGTTKDISLCGLKVKSFGRNLPCVDLDTEPFYHPHANPLDGNKVAGLKFSALSNVGKKALVKNDVMIFRLNPHNIVIKD
ncbi:uncharacterized protein TNCV_3847531 [Trichonephila clavipes]|nr:uncharacterized protein TNCV_3847531 [Trichonephila clavipes]